MPMEKTFSPTEAEARISKQWIDGKVGAAGANAKPGAETYSIMIPPPNVTGSLHIGHAFNNTLQDILIRWHRMRGFDTLWQVGTDHAGIATQMVVERELAKTGNKGRRELGREAFLEKVWEWKETSGGTIINQLQRLGATCDWDREAFTMSGNFPDAVTKVFVDMYNKGLIYRGKRLVNWDPHFETAISDLEVENIEVAGHMWHFKYILADGDTYEYVEKDAEGRVTLRETRDYISIATTRPETMLGDGAVAVHPTDARYAAIVGKMVHLPLCDRLIPIITDDYPDPLFGSGAVKITGAHDFNDYAVAQRHNIPLYPLMDTKGVMRADDAPDNLVPLKYRGLDRFEARKQVVADITAQGLAVTVLVKSIDEETGSEHLTREPVVEAKKIMQPHGDRSKVVIEPMLTDQWFVDTAKIVSPALDAVRNGDTRIIPESGEKTYFHWLENIEPWCISRQLWWGHRIPVWYMGAFNMVDGQPISDGYIEPDTFYYRGRLLKFCRSNRAEATLQAQDFIAIQLGTSIANVIVADLGDEEYLGVLAERYGLGPDDFLNAGRAPVKLSDDKYLSTFFRDPDVLDTWFSSGLWPIGTLGWPEATPELQKYFPTSTLITGADIIFFWVARMMMMQLAVVGEVPFKTVYLHGLVRDAKGKKMSKSLGNVIDPLAIIDEFGADALRFSNAAMASLGGVLKLDTQRIAGYRNFGTKLWNACRFAEMNGVWEGHTTGNAPTPHATANRWIIGEAAKTLQEVNASLEEFRFDQAANALYTFIWGKVCDWYVEFAKPLLENESLKRETQQTLGWVLWQSMIMLHPIMPFITEELWATTGEHDRLLVLTDWPAFGTEKIDAAADQEMNWVVSVIEDIRSARSEMHVPVGLKLPMVSLNMDATATAYWSRNQTLIHRLARIESLTEATTAPKGAITIPVQGATFAIPLAGIIDIAEEKSRLSKTLDKLTKEITGLNGRLNNPNFATSAPEDVVMEARSNLDARLDEQAKLNAALQRLADMS